MRVLSKGSKVSKGEKPKWGGKRAVKSPVRKRTTAKTAERKKKAKKRIIKQKKIIPTLNELELLAFFDPSNPLLHIKKKKQGEISVKSKYHLPSQRRTRYTPSPTTAIILKPLSQFASLIAATVSLPSPPKFDPRGKSASPTIEPSQNDTQNAQQNAQPTTPDLQSPTSAPANNAMTPYEKQLKSQLKRRNTQIELLKNQLTAHGDVPIEEIVTLEEANNR